MDKVHCVFLVDGEMKVLFESQQFKRPEQLGTAPIDLVLKKELIQEYLEVFFTLERQLPWSQPKDFNLWTTRTRQNVCSSNLLLYHMGSGKIRGVEMIKRLR